MAKSLVSRRSLFACFAVLAWTLAATPAARADCASLPPLERSLAAADVAFVGTVILLEDDDRTATFRVEEVWKGQVGPTAVVHGGPGLRALERAARRGQSLMSTVDRIFDPAARYLVLPWGRSGEVLRDNACTATQLYTRKLNRFRPDSVSVPSEAARSASGDRPAVEDSGETSWPRIALAIGGLAAAAAAAWLLARARRTRSAR